MILLFHWSSQNKDDSFVTQKYPKIFQLCFLIDNLKEFGFFKILNRKCRHIFCCNTSSVLMCYKQKPIIQDYYKAIMNTALVRLMPDFTVVFNGLSSKWMDFIRNFGLLTDVLNCVNPDSVWLDQINIHLSPSCQFSHRFILARYLNQKKISSIISNECVSIRIRRDSISFIIVLSD